MISEQSPTLAFRGGFSLTDKQLSSVGVKPIVSSPTKAAAAVVYQYLDIDQTDNLLTSVTASSETKNVLNNVNMESTASATIKNCNNDNRNIFRNSKGNTVSIHQVQNVFSDSAGGVAIANLSKSPHQKYCQQIQSMQINPHNQHTVQKKQSQNTTNNVKSERLSPGTNGDHQSSISRSRSTTPSSFRGPSPQQISSEALMPITSLLRIQEVTSAGNQPICVTTASKNTANIGNTTTVFQTEYTSRNYSNIMRNLAAKYNDTNSINPLSTRYNPFFDTSSSTSSIPIGNKNINQKGGNRNVVGALSGSLPSKDVSSLIPRLSMSQGEVAVAAAAASFLSSLPFSQSVCLPMIDMSSTQALVTLARAAKEAEVQTILRSFQQNSNHINCNSNLTHPNLSVALQQAAQYVSPALNVPAQQQQQSSPQHKLISTPTRSCVSTSKRKSTAPRSTTTVPLDLSSQPPATKRFKVELNSASNSHESLSNEVKLLSSPKSENKLAIGSTNSNARLCFSPEPFIPCNTGILKCQAQSEEIAQWTVDDVCTFVGDIDICADYVQHFREQCIDGTGLPLLTEDHLLNSLGMKLGPALKLRSKLAQRLGGPCPCVVCITRARQMLVLHAESNNSQPTIATNMSNEGSPAKENVDIPKHINDKTKETCQDIQKSSQNEQLLADGQEPKICSNSDNNERTSNYGSLKLQICANIYKNETNNNHHNNDEVNIENFTGETNIHDKTSSYILDTTFKTITNNECLSNNTSSTNSNVVPGSQFGELSDEGS